MPPVRIISAAPIPVQDRLVHVSGELAGIITDPWTKYFTNISDIQLTSPVRLVQASKVSQSASIGATALSIGQVGTGLYRVSYYITVTVAASTSSSMTVTIAWTDEGISKSQSGAAMTGNTTTTQQNGTFLINIDSSSPVTYAVVYASVGATPAQFKISVVIEQVSA